MSSFALVSAIFILLYITAIFSIDVFMDKLKNYSIYQVTAFSNRERNVLYTLHSKVDDMVFINGISNEASLPMDVLVDNCCIGEFESIMQSNDIEFVKTRPTKIIAVSADLKGSLQMHLTGKPVMDLSKEFLCYDLIQQWVKYKLKKNSILKEIKIGQTYEKRDIFILKLSTGIRRKAVFLMGGEEGRDWISTAILLNLIDHILDKTSNLEILLSHYDFYVLPLFNPDGYMYSMVKDRLWTKNTRVYFPKVPCSENISSIGINIDRNWYFDSKNNIRNDECDTVFTGLKPLSEEETNAVSKFLNKVALRLMAFINVRGFENLVTIPYGYNKHYCNNYNALLDIVTSVHDSVVNKHNSTFYYGLTSKYIYNFSGNVADWVKKELNTPIVYTVYMKVASFVLPSVKDIQPLTAQLSTMIKEILLLANTFYGPLFYKQYQNSSATLILIFNIHYYIVSLVCLKDCI